MWDSVSLSSRGHTPLMLILFFVSGFAVAPHPSLSEALKEAALAADGNAIHIAHRRRSG